MESYNYYFQDSECDSSPLWIVGILFKGQTEYILSYDVAYFVKKHAMVDFM